MNNFSLLAANRLTHLKVVAVALVFATLVVSIGFAARVTDGSGTSGLTSCGGLCAPTPFGGRDYTNARIPFQLRQPVYELRHMGYSGFDSHTTTLAPPPKRGFFSRNNTTGDWFPNFFRERFTDVLT